MIDYSRKWDLEELYRLRKGAINSMERDRYDHTIGEIMRASGATVSMREKLVRAIRSDDVRAIKYFNNELDLIRARETNGAALR